LNRQQLVRTEFVIAHRELRLNLHLQARAIAVVPFRRSTDLQIGEADFRGPQQRLPQYGRLNFKLSLVIRMLVVTSPTAQEIGTCSFYPRWGWFNDVFHPSARESWLLLGECRFNLLTLENKRKKHSFARPMLISRQPRQTIAAINKFFDLDLHRSGLYGLGQR